MKAFVSELAYDARSGRQRRIWVEMWLCNSARDDVRSWLPFRDPSHVLGSGTSDGHRAWSEASKAKCRYPMPWPGVACRLASRLDCASSVVIWAQVSEWSRGETGDETCGQQAPLFLLPSTVPARALAIGARQRLSLHCWPQVKKVRRHQRPQARQSEAVRLRRLGMV